MLCFPFIVLLSNFSVPSIPSNALFFWYPFLIISFLSIFLSILFLSFSQFSLFYLLFYLFLPLLFLPLCSSYSGEKERRGKRKDRTGQESRVEQRRVEERRGEGPFSKPGDQGPCSAWHGLSLIGSQNTRLCGLVGKLHHAKVAEAPLSAAPSLASLAAPVYRALPVLLWVYQQRGFDGGFKRNVLVLSYGVYTIAKVPRLLYVSVPSYLVLRGFLSLGNISFFGDFKETNVDTQLLVLS